MARTYVPTYWIANPVIQIPKADEKPHFTGLPEIIPFKGIKKAVGEYRHNGGAIILDVSTDKVWNETNIEWIEQNCVWASRFVNLSSRIRKYGKSINMETVYEFADDCYCLDPEYFD